MIGGMIGLFVGMLGGIAGAYVMGRLRAQTARGLADQILANANREAETTRMQAELQAKQDMLRRRDELDREMEETRKGLREQERRIEKRGDLLDQKLELINRKDREFESIQHSLSEQQEELQKRQLELKQTHTEQRELLCKIGRLAPEEARSMLLARVQEELRGEVGLLIMQHEASIRESCQQRAREILTTTIQRYAASHTAEVTVSTVDIPSDEMKGRIIGREGRNIRAFEKATGVDVIVDDTPGVVIVTGFDSVRREIAKIALEKLIQDGRIHPTRIEEIVKETQEEMEQHIRRLGQEAALEANVVGLHEKLMDYLGRLKFRTSYSQNVLRHSLEVAYLTGLMAEEIGLNGALGRRCGLLARHRQGGRPRDGRRPPGGRRRAGQAVRRELRRWSTPRSAITTTCGSMTPYTVLVAAADAISASRPGARRETLEKYVRRLEELESLALGFPGVEHAYAIQAGREVRVLVDSQQLDDADSASLCRDIARAIQNQLTYPGEVKVTVLRETRAVEFAR